MRHLKLLLLVMATFFVASAAFAQGGLFTPRPSALPDICTKTTLGGGTCGALRDGQLAWISNSDGVESGENCKTGPTGTARVLCYYDALAATWKPWHMGGGGGGLSNPLVGNLDAANHDFTNVGNITFGALRCDGFANGGKVTTTAAGLVQCADDVASAGSGHTIQQNGTTLPTQTKFNMILGGNNLCADNPGTGATDCSLPAYTARVLVGGNQFTGTVNCDTNLPQSTGAPITRCKAHATAFGGISAPSGGWFELEGTYDPNSPAKTTDGFQVSRAVYGPPSSSCLVGGDCGTAMTNWLNNVRTLATNYNAGRKPVVAWAPATYNGFDGIHSMKFRGAGWTVDWTNHPTFFSQSNMAGATTVLAGTGSVSVSSNPSELVTTGSNFCGSGSCFDGDELVRPGDVLKLGNVTWENSGVGAGQVVIVKDIIDSSHIRFDPPLTGDISGVQMEVGYAKIVEFDNTSTTIAGGAMEGGSNTILGLAYVDCQGLCQSVNPWAAGGARTAGNGFRTVPLQGVVLRHTTMNVSLGISNICGKHDAFLTTTFSTTNATASSSTGTFTGNLGGCTDWHETAWQAMGADPNSASDDGIGSGIRQISSDFDYNPHGVAAGFGRFLFATGNCSISHYNTRRVEQVAQLAWLPQGCEDMDFDGTADEHFMGCDNGVEYVGVQPPCGAQAARRPWIDLGKYSYNSGDNLVSNFRFNFSNIFFWVRPVTFLRVTDDHHVRIQLNGMVADSLKLLDIANNETQVSGHVLCDVGSSPVSTACDRPTLGTFPDFFVSDLTGFKWSGRRLDQMDPNVPLPIGMLGDDDAHTAGTYQVVNGGPGGVPTWAAISGGGVNLDGLSDVSTSGSLTGYILAATGDGISGPFAMVTPAFKTSSGYTYPFDVGTNIAVGATSGGPPATDADIVLGAAGQAVFNQQGGANAVGFQVLGDTNANLFRASYALDRVYVGTNSGTNLFNVGGNMGVTGTLAMLGAGSAGQVSFTEGSPTGWTCGASDFWIRANSTTHRLQKCDNSAITDIGSGSGGGITSLHDDGSGVTTSATPILSGGAGMTVTCNGTTTCTFVTNSAESGFLTDGGASDLGSGGGTQGRMQVMDSGELQYVDGSAALQRALRKGAGSYAANQILVPSGTGTDIIARSATIDGNNDMVLPGSLTINGDTDVTQLAVKAAAGQDVNDLIFTVRNSSNAILMSLTGTGVLTVNTLSVACDGAGGCYSTFLANSADIADPGGSQQANLGMFGAKFVARLSGEGASHEILRDNSNLGGSNCGVFDNLSTADTNKDLQTFPYAVTISKVGCRCRGSCAAMATINFESSSGTAMTGTPSCASNDNDVTFTAISANGALATGKGIRFDASGSPTPGDTYTICYQWTVP